MIKLLDQVRDEVSGFEGIVVAITEYAYSNKSFGVCSKVKDNKLENWKWFEESQLKVIQ